MVLFKKVKNDKTIKHMFEKSYFLTFTNHSKKKKIKKYE